MIVCAPRLLRLLTGNFARAITLFPFILLRDDCDQRNPVLINHERIHLRQQRELWVLPFYFLYLGEYCRGRIQGLDHLQSYLAISFEQEAYQQERNLSYLENRPFFASKNYYKKRH